MNEVRKEEIRENLQQIHAEMQKLAKDTEQVQLICVSKNHPLRDILLANSLGETEFAENRVQELREKQAEFARLPEQIRKEHQLHWHMIGTLQRNKVKDVVGNVTLIHSVDTTALLQQINKISEQKNLVSDILLQVNIAKEKSKKGFFVEDLEQVIETRQRFKQVNLRGFMVIAPFFEDHALAKVGAIFAEAHSLLKKYQKVVGKSFDQLSMGMSHDYAYAIKEGATLIRIGTDIFGKREI